jgi:putative ABC transport system permease protein
MLKTITASFLLAIQNIRSNFFHTVLSLLGIVIGVASLVSILSLIDGMEKFAQDQISRTTSLKSIVINTQTNKIVNGVSVKKDSIQHLTYHDFQELQTSLTLPATGFLWQTRGKELHVIDDTLNVASLTTAVSNLDTSFTVVAGKLLSEDDFKSARKNCIITVALAKLLTKDKIYESLVNRKVVFSNDTITVIGVASSSRTSNAELFYPITILSKTQLSEGPPQAMIDAREVTDVQNLKTEIVNWLTKRFGPSNDFSVATNEFRVEQAAQGFMLFRIIMGLIVGISVLVGGIGVMNVLLISVTERTSEIGVRKAVGANKRDIVLQFLSESITISLFGSLIGLIVGILGTMAFVPIIKSLTKVPFQAAYTLNTLLVISILSVVVGIVFGTYPAVRASRLDPVEAIRRNE